MRSHDAIAIVSSHHPKGTILQFWGNSRILNAIHNHSANSSANRTITLWFRHNPPDRGGFTPCRSASISIHTILWSFLQAIPDQKIHQQLQNLLTILGCLPQSVWITSRLQVRKGLQVDWKDCIEIGWIAEQQRKTMSTWVNSWTQHQSTALPPLSIHCPKCGHLDTQFQLNFTISTEFHHFNGISPFPLNSGGIPWINNFRSRLESQKAWLQNVKLRPLIEIKLARPIRSQDFRASINSTLPHSKLVKDWSQLNQS